jgi:hypothetical protein
MLSAIFCTEMMEEISVKDYFLYIVVFNNEGTFHLSGTLNHHNVHTWDLENPHGMIEHATNSPKVKVFCALSANKVFHSLQHRSLQALHTLI